MQGAMEAAPLVDYRLRPGDEVEIKFFYHKILDEKQTIGPDGKITLQLVDEILAAGLTSAQLDDVLTEEYAKYLEHYQISVIVRKFSGLKVYVGGEVRNPGYLELAGNMSILQAITARGGMKVSGKEENVILIRKGPDNRPVAMAIDMEPVLDGKDLESDIYLMPSDIVYVPKTFIAKAGDFVDLYMRRVLFMDRILEGVGYALGYRWVEKHY
jgi:protein involved in polysaccharide export with SLBB domain